MPKVVRNCYNSSISRSRSSIGSTSSSNISSASDIEISNKELKPISDIKIPNKRDLLALIDITIWSGSIAPAMNSSSEPSYTDVVKWSPSAGISGIILCARSPFWVAACFVSSSLWLNLKSIRLEKIWNSQQRASISRRSRVWSLIPICPNLKERGRILSTDMRATSLINSYLKPANTNQTLALWTSTMRQRWLLVVWPLLACHGEICLASFKLEAKNLSGTLYPSITSSRPRGV